MFRSTYSTLWLVLLGPGVIAALSLGANCLVDGHWVPLVFLAGFGGLLWAVFHRAHKAEGMTLARLGVRGPTYLTWVVAAALAAFFIYVFGPFLFWLVDMLGIDTFDPGLEDLTSVPTALLVLNIVVVAAGEEWLYPCYAIERLMDVPGNVWLAGSLSLLAFVLVHLPLWRPGPALTTLISGGLLTLYYIATRDIAALIVTHVAVDLYGLVWVS